MQKLNVADSYPRPTRQRQTIPTYEDDTWSGLPYRPDTACPQCKGAGFVHPREGGRVAFDRVIPCPAPGCLKGIVQGLVPDQTFENFKPVAGAQKALKAAQALAYGETDFVWLLIYGGTGNGKTHLCNAIVSVVRDRGCDVRMMMAADLFSQLREAIRDNQVEQVLRRYKDIYFLAIDEYGVEYGSDWEMAKFDELMTSRFATAKPTVLTTNRDISELPERLRSRFNDKLLARAIQNTAPDYRQRKGDNSWR